MYTKVLPYLKYAPTVALFAGFVLDVFTLNKPDALFENTVILGYLFLSALVMIILQARPADAGENRRLLLLSILQFAFGNLAGALLVLYARSGTLAGSAIFIGILVLLFLGNETLRDRYARTQLRIIIWFTLLLTYCTLVVPVFLGSIGTFAFLLSIGVAVVVTTALVFALSKLAHGEFSTHTRRIGISTAIVTIVFGALYFSNLIPPVPLSLKHIGIYHSLEVTDAGYAATFEAPSWYEFWRDTSSVFGVANDTSAYCFSSVYAPGKLKTEIRHRWERYDAEQKKWITIARVPFSISGGRDEGFRGYSRTSQITAGKWRCSVETSRGVLIGRTTFNAVDEVYETTETQL